MIAEKLIANSLVNLHATDTVAQGLTIMHINYVKHLPVIQGRKLLGIASEEELLRLEEDTLLKDIKLEGPSLSAFVDEHVFEILQKITEHKLTSIPVLDHNENYVGLISHEDLLKFYAKSFSFSEEGGILVLEVNRRSYALSEIARIVELENASIIGLFITEIPESVNVLVTMKINRIDIQSIIKAFDRYDYQIKATYAEKEVMDDIKERYDSLMSYLNV